MAHPLTHHLVACFTGAALDNLFRQVALVAMAVAAVRLHPGDPVSAEKASNHYSFLAMILFNLPFIVLAPAAGALGDRIAKQRLVRWVRLVDVPICVFGILGFANGQPAMLLVALTCLAIASATFAPVKLAIVPELVAPAALGAANGRLAATTVVAILVGTCLSALTDPAGLLTILADAARGLPHALAGPAQWCQRIAAAIAAHPILPTLAFVALCTALCATGIVAAFRLPRLAPAARSSSGDGAAWSPMQVAHQIRALIRTEGVAVPSLALGGFWGLGAVAMVGFPPMAVAVYGVQQAGVATMMLCLVAGVCIGSLAAPRLTAPAFPAGLPIVGAFISGGALFAVGRIAGAVAAPAAAHPSWAPLIIWLILAGVGAGLWEVPLTVLVQRRSPPERRNLLMGATSAIGAICCAVAAGIYGLLTGPPPLLAALLPHRPGSAAAGLSSAQAIAALGAVVVVGATLCGLRWSRQLAAFAMVLVVRQAWRLRVIGSEHLPERGGVVVCCNHLSFADGLVVAASLPRPGRFLVYRAYTEMPVVGWFLRAAGVIPVAAEDRRRALVAAIEAATAAAAAGEVVVIFPEGRITRNGQVDTFHGGIERIAARAQVPMVPAYLHGLYGGPFSRAPRRGWPRPWRRLSLMLGSSLASDASAAEARLHVMGLSVEHAHARAARDHRTLGMAALHRAFFHPVAPAIRDAGGAMGRWRLLAAAQALRGLLGLARDERAVGVLLPPGRGGTLINLALALDGRTAVNLNHTAGDAQVARMCELSGVRTIISSALYRSKLGNPALPGTVVNAEDLIPRLGTGAVLWNGILNHLLPARWRCRARADDVAAVIFSSGSTGDPKGVELTHRQILANCHSVKEGLDLHGDQDTLLSPLPLFHSFGLVPGMWLGLAEGVAIAAQPNPLDGKALGELAAATRATFLISTPTFARSYLRQTDPAHFKSLRFAVVGAERCPPELKDAFKERFGAELLEGYGCTELAPVVAANLPTPEVPGEGKGGAREGSVGRALPGQHVYAVHPESLEPLPLGAEGLLVVRSPARMRGYLGREDLTAKAFISDGYITGDLGKVDADGFIFITGRLARFAKIGGEMVPLDTIEVAIQAVIGEAAEVAVASVPDPARGERLVVMHTGYGGSWDEVLAKLESLPQLWRPKARDVLKVDAVPKLGTGKRDLAGVKKLAIAATTQAGGQGTRGAGGSG